MVQKIKEEEKVLEKTKVPELEDEEMKLQKRETDELKKKIPLPKKIKTLEDDVLKMKPMKRKLKSTDPDQSDPSQSNDGSDSPVGEKVKIDGNNVPTLDDYVAKTQPIFKPTPKDPN